MFDLKFINVDLISRGPTKNFGIALYIKMHEVIFCYIIKCRRWLPNCAIIARTFMDVLLERYKTLA